MGAGGEAADYLAQELLVQPAVSDVEISFLLSSKALKKTLTFQTVSAERWGRPRLFWTGTGIKGALLNLLRSPFKLL